MHVTLQCKVTADPPVDDVAVYFSDDMDGKNKTASSDHYFVEIAEGVCCIRDAIRDK